jgi:hypothetical protein
VFQSAEFMGELCGEGFRVVPFANGGILKVGVMLTSCEPAHGDGAAMNGAPGTRHPSE